MRSIDRRGLLGVLASLSLAGCLGYFADDREEITDPGDIEIIYHDLVRSDIGTDDERVAVVGVVEHVGDRDLRYIEIRATFFDAEGEELDRVIQTVRGDVGEGNRWSFEVEYPRFGEAAAAVESYDLEPVTGV